MSMNNSYSRYPFHTVWPLLAGRGLVILLVLSLSTFSTLCGGMAAADNIASSSLRIIVKGLKNDCGAVVVHLFNSQEEYLKAAFISVVARPLSKKAIAEFRDLPIGEYAFVLIHDKNENGILDQNALGLPMERYGFSRNARGRFGPAKYHDAKFVVNDQNQDMEITVR